MQVVPVDEGLRDRRQLVVAEVELEGKFLIWVFTAFWNFFLYIYIILGVAKFTEAEIKVAQN